MFLQIKIKKNWENIYNFEIKNLIETINDKPGDYDKIYMRTKFNSDDNLPLNKILKLVNLAIFVRLVFQDKKIIHKFF